MVAGLHFAVLWLLKYKLAFYLVIFYPSCLYAFNLTPDHPRRKVLLYSEVLTQNSESRAFSLHILCLNSITYYTPDIRSMCVCVGGGGGYIVFSFPFVRSFVCTYVRSFVRSFVRSSFRHRVKVFALKFIRPHILKTL